MATKTEQIRVEISRDSVNIFFFWHTLNEGLDLSFFRLGETRRRMKNGKLNKLFIFFYSNERIHPLHTKKQKSEKNLCQMEIIVSQ